MKLKINPLADDEVVESAKYYERLESGWGERFLHEFDRAIARILDAPDRWPVRDHGLRKSRTAARNQVIGKTEF